MVEFLLWTTGLGRKCSENWNKAFGYETNNLVQQRRTGLRRYSSAACPGFVTKAVTCSFWLMTLESWTSFLLVQHLVVARDQALCWGGATAASMWNVCISSRLTVAQFGSLSPPIPNLVSLQWLAAEFTGVFGFHVCLFRIMTQWRTEQIHVSLSSWPFILWTNSSRDGTFTGPKGGFKNYAPAVFTFDFLIWHNRHTHRQTCWRPKKKCLLHPTILDFLSKWWSWLRPMIECLSFIGALLSSQVEETQRGRLRFEGDRPAGNFLPLMADDMVQFRPNLFHRCLFSYLAKKQKFQLQS